MAFHVTCLTLFPDAFPGMLDVSIIGSARSKGLWELDTVDLRGFGRGKHRQVDDTPAGGGAGMVMRADVLADAIDSVEVGGRPRILLSPRGRPLTQSLVRELSAGPGLIAVCGRFEGVDQRVIDGRELLELSLGDFVLAGGEVAAMALIEACVRLQPGVAGNPASLEQESHEKPLLEHPQYTRPASWEGREIPEILLSGDHGAIEKWRQNQAEELTKARRPDLYARFRDISARPEVGPSRTRK